MIRRCIGLFFVIALLAPPAMGQEAVGSSFTYQGQLRFAGLSLSGSFDFRFELFETSSGGTSLAETILEATPVTEGFFSVALDFGSAVFQEDAVWLQVSVREGGDTGAFIELLPRSRVTATPFAIRAAHATDTDRLGGRTSSEFLRADGTISADQLTVTGGLVIDELIFPDGTRQSTASTSSRPVITEPSTFSSARLICGSAPETDPVQWTFVTGRFRVTIDGFDYEPQASFEGVSTMEDVANRLQTGVRAVTGGQEGVTWQGDHFVVTSGDTTASSSIAPAESPLVGVDISGASVGNNWMDCDAERAVVRASVLDGSADEGKLVALGSLGRIDPLFLPQRKLALSTEGITVDTNTATEIARFAIPGGTLGDSGIVRVHLKAILQTALNSTSGFDFEVFYGSSSLGVVSAGPGGFQTRHVDLEIDVMSRGSTTTQKTLISLVARSIGSLITSDFSTQATSIDSSQNHDLRIVASRRSGASLEVLSHLAWTMQ